ncbi:MAG: phosphatase PAP2 family protein [Bifidobacterium sp.]|jgi:membrane-associated phospholipid phosphatase|nr:phosphatase PAP2 family protein [Bifidobacterium sp.]
MKYNNHQPGLRRPRRLLRMSAAFGAAAAILLTGATAQAAVSGGYYSDTHQPDLVALLDGFTRFYRPGATYDSKNPSTFGRGTVANADVLRHNDESTLAINQAGAAGGDGRTPTAQQKRALVDSDYKMSETLPDALGPVLGGYFSQGLRNGSLPKTAELLTRTDPGTGWGDSLLADYLSTTTAKITFNHPRPYVDRTDAGYPAAGLSTTLPIAKAPVWTDDNAITHNPSYDAMLTSGSFPSGHTTYAYSGAVGLATLLPQLGTEIVTRGSEAGNNRIVLGVHYSLDIMGGRIDGEAADTARWSDAAFRSDKLMPAYDELQAYMARQCVDNGNTVKQDNDFDTVQSCVSRLGANADKGYTNSFTDAVSIRPVTDRQSAIAAYTARLSYGFSQDSRQAGLAPVVPEGAQNLLLTAFPTLTDAERTQVLAASEIDSGYPLDDTSQGYQRLNLAKAYSAKVTLSSDASRVVKVEPGQSEASVVREGSANGAGGANNTNNTNNTNGEPSASPAPAAASAPRTPLAETGSGALMLLAVSVALVGAGGIALWAVRRHRS